jgi:hypothetical protein
MPVVFRKPSRDAAADRPQGVSASQPRRADDLVSTARAQGYRRRPTERRPSEGPGCVLGTPLLVGSTLTGPLTTAAGIVAALRRDAGHDRDLRRALVIISPTDRNLLRDLVIKSMNDHPFAVEVAIFIEPVRHVITRPRHGRQVATLSHGPRGTHRSPDSHARPSAVACRTTA